MSIIKWHYEIWPYLHSQPCWPDQFIVRVSLYTASSWKYNGKVTPTYFRRLFSVAYERGYEIVASEIDYGMYYEWRFNKLKDENETARYSY